MWGVVVWWERVLWREIGGRHWMLVEAWRGEMSGPTCFKIVTINATNWRGCERNLGKKRTVGGVVGRERLGAGGRVKDLDVFIVYSERINLQNAPRWLRCRRCPKFSKECSLSFEEADNRRAKENR